MKFLLVSAGLLVFVGSPARALICNVEIARAFNFAKDRLTTRTGIYGKLILHKDGLEIVEEIDRELTIEPVSSRSDWNRVLYPLPEGTGPSVANAFIKSRVNQRGINPYGNNNKFCYGFRDPTSITEFASEMISGMPGISRRRRRFEELLGPRPEPDPLEKKYLEKSRGFFLAVLDNVKTRKLEAGEINWLRISYENREEIDFGFSFKADGSPRLLVIFERKAPPVPGTPVP